MERAYLNLCRRISFLTALISDGLLVPCPLSTLFQTVFSFRLGDYFHFSATRVGDWNVCGW